MPKKGYKSLTISASTYDKIAKFYQTHKDELRLQGITSLAGLAEKYLSLILLEDDQPKDRDFRSDDA